MLNVTDLIALQFEISVLITVQHVWFYCCTVVSGEVLFHHTCMGVQAVVWATGLSNEMSQTSAPHSSVTTLPILIKLEPYNCCQKTAHHAKRYFDPTAWVVWANTQFAICHYKVFSFLVCSSREQVTLWTDFDDLYIVWRLSTWECALIWGSVDISPHLWGQILKKT